jgi:glucosyl-3-phosphoglycerate synthase
MTVGAIVAAALRSPLVDEVLVVDDGSRDATGAEAAAAGARIVTGDGAGKGRAMWRALEATDADVVVFCDADLDSFDEGYVASLVAPLLLDDRVMFVKATYERFLDGRPGEGGRVNELLARPALRVLFPELAWVRQPLGGECAGRRRALETVPFVEGWGVVIALVIDMASRFGPAGIAQADLGERRHRNRTLAELAPQAEAVLRTVLARAGVGPAVPECPPLDDGLAPRSARSA